jgi:DNA-binding LacI/PurR family transcriptional regulator
MTGPRRRRGPTISDVARLAEVTPAVVSRVLNDDEKLRIRAETRQKVLDAAQVLDYTPNGVARGLALARSGALALIVHNIGNPLHAETVQGAQRRAQGARWALLLADAEELVDNVTAYKDILESRRVDGVILHVGGLPGDESLKRLAQSRLPSVLINSQLGGVVSSVTLQDEAATRLAVDYLLGLGHREIAFFCGTPGSAQSERREREFNRALKRARITPRPEWIIEGGWDESSGRRAMRQLMSMARRPTAILGGNVMASIGALATARELGVRVPDDLSVIAIHDTWVAEHTWPPLTAVRLPLRQLGEVAVDVVLDMLKGGARRDVVVADPGPELIVRASTAPAHPADR